MHTGAAQPMLATQVHCLMFGLVCLKVVDVTSIIVCLLPFKVLFWGYAWRDGLYFPVFVYHSLLVYHSLRFAGAEAHCLTRRA